jgi:predicted N-acetyltransferase YhbS
MNWGITSEYDTAPESFMLMELKKGELLGKSGVINYHDAFKNV